VTADLFDSAGAGTRGLVTRISRKVGGKTGQKGTGTACYRKPGGRAHPGEGKIQTCSGRRNNSRKRVKGNSNALEKKGSKGMSGQGAALGSLEQGT